MGDTFWPMTSARLTLGDDIIKKLFVDQEPVLSRDTRQMAEFMVRGRYPIGSASTRCSSASSSARGSART